MHMYLLVKKVYSHAKKKLYAHIKIYVYIPVEKGGESLFTREEKKYVLMYKCTCIC